VKIRVTLINKLMGYTCVIFLLFINIFLIGGFADTPDSPATIFDAATPVPPSYALLIELAGPYRPLPVVDARPVVDQDEESVDVAVHAAPPNILREVMKHGGSYSAKYAYYDALR